MKRLRVSKETLIQLLRRNAHVDPAYRMDISAPALLHRRKSRPTPRSSPPSGKQELVALPIRLSGQIHTQTFITFVARRTMEPRKQALTCVSRNLLSEGMRAAKNETHP